MSRPFSPFENLRNVPAEFQNQFRLTHNFSSEAINIRPRQIPKRFHTNHEVFKTQKNMLKPNSHRNQNQTVADPM